MGMPESFGAELRRLRLAAGLTLTQLGAAVSYSKGHLSKIELGQKVPPTDLARRCDVMLRADGRLLALAPPVEPRRGRPARRQVLVAGAGSLLAIGLGGPAAGEAVAGAAMGPGAGGVFGVPVAEFAGSPGTLADPHITLAVFRAQFDQMRRLGQICGPATVLPLLAAQLGTLRELAGRAAASDRPLLLALAARYAEFAGWMAQEAGSDRAALHWTEQAVALAEAGADRQLAGYAQVRRALITFYAGDAVQTVELARLAQHPALPPRIRGLAAQREAQGHALAGDRTACLRSLDQARALLARAAAETPQAAGESGPTLGTTQLADPAAMVTGWCLHDLGRPGEAAVVLDQEYARIAPEALRTRARYGMRRALAHAAAGEIEHACALAGELLALTGTVPSATIASDVRRLARELSRFRANRAVRALQPALAAALRPDSTPGFAG
ncbi:helix-turn-helix domain-containing protein [Kitasatospora sp. NPDC008050]|uniref:helix-turn-helix domain-containing protein n=1 Tax=Kitasatospora sp. NPDC008050 TaxID=3364021 RepID=UPI0036F0F895